MGGKIRKIIIIMNSFKNINIYIKGNKQSSKM